MRRRATGDWAAGNTRGLSKVKSLLLWFMLAHKLLRIAAIAPALLGPGGHA